MPAETTSTTCSETGRSFATSDEARASEARFRYVQAECDAGHVPELRNGDVIYVDTELYVGHGRDDFRGGLAEVDQFGTFIGSPFVRVAQEADTQHNWEILAPMQKKLRQKFGMKWAHPDPDYRPEFNED